MGPLSCSHTAARQLAASVHFSEGRAAEGRRSQKRPLTRQRLPPTWTCTDLALPLSLPRVETATAFGNAWPFRPPRWTPRHKAGFRAVAAWRRASTLRREWIQREVIPCEMGMIEPLWGPGLLWSLFTQTRRGAETQQAWHTTLFCLSPIFSFN